MNDMDQEDREAMRREAQFVRNLEIFTSTAVIAVASIVTLFAIYGLTKFVKWAWYN